MPDASVISGQSTVNLPATTSIQTGRMYGPGYPLNAPTYTPPLHSLIASAVFPPDEPNDRWEAGFEFEPEGRLPVLVHPGMVCPPDIKPEKVVQTPPPLIQYAPFQLVTSYACPWGRTEAEREAKVRRQLGAGESKALETELWAGALGSFLGNMSLTGAGSVVLNPGIVDPATATPVSMHAAMSLLAQHLADQGPGNRGMLHMGVYTAELAANRCNWVEDGRAGGSVLRTMGRGDVVVVGSGYPRTGPGGNIPTAGRAWIHASSMIHVRLGDIVILGAGIEGVRRTSNSMITHIAERTGAAYWDGAPVGSVLVDLTIAA